MYFTKVEKVHMFVYPNILHNPKQIAWELNANRPFYIFKYHRDVQQLWSMTKDLQMETLEMSRTTPSLPGTDGSHKATDGFTSELTVALCSSSAVSIGGVGGPRGAGDDPQHGDGGLGGALQEVEGLNVAPTWNESEGFPRA